VRQTSVNALVALLFLVETVLVPVTVEHIARRVLVITIWIQYLADIAQPAAVKMGRIMHHIVGHRLTPFADAAGVGPEMAFRAPHAPRCNSMLTLQVCTAAKPALQVIVHIKMVTQET